MSPLNPQAIARDHGFDTVSIAWTSRGYWTLWAHGQDVGDTGVVYGRGDTPSKALSDALYKVRAYRETQAILAVTGEDAKSRRIADLRAELSTLTGEPV